MQKIEKKMEDITHEDYTHTQKIFEEITLKNLGDYHDLYTQSDTLYLQVFLKTLETSVLKYMNSILLIFCLHQD